MPKQRKSETLRQLQRRNRQAQALDLHVKGLTYREIAKKMRISTSTAHDYVQDALREITRPKAEEVLELHLERYRQLLLGIMPKALLGRLPEVDRVMNIMARVERLHGVESPRESDQTTETYNALSQLLEKAAAQQGM